MSKLNRLLLIALLSFSGIATVLAASLEKYSTPPGYGAEPKAKKNPREIAIEKAVRRIQDAPPEKRSQLIEEYRKRAKSAMEQKRYDEARFYTEILSRSGN